MKTMNIKNAVDYCASHKAVIHAPKESICNAIMLYLEEQGFTWGEKINATKFKFHYNYGDDTCIMVNNNKSIGYSGIDYFHHYCYEIIEIK